MSNKDLKIHTTITHKRHQKPKFTFKAVISGLLISTTMLSTAVSLPTNALGDNFSTVVYAEQISSTNVGSLLSDSKEEVDYILHVLKKDNALNVDSINNIYNSLKKINDIVNNEGYRFTAMEQQDLAYISTQYNAIELNDSTLRRAAKLETAKAFNLKIMDETKEFLSFLMSQSSVTTSGSYSNFKQGSVKHFSDVQSNDWFYSWVSDASMLGIIEGMGDGIFAPQENLTYAQALVLACRVNAIYFDREEELKYYPGTTNHWASGTEAYARNYGITKYNIDLDDFCTRDMMIYMFAHALSQSEYTETDSLQRQNYINSVVDTPGSLKDENVAKLYLMGIVVGSEKGFELDKNLTRAEAAAMIVRLAVPDKRYKIDSSTPEYQEEAFAQYQLETLDLVNASRAEEGLPPLKLSKALCAAAEQLATEYSQGATAHKRLNGIDSFSLFPEWHYSLSGVTGENYARGCSGAYDAHAGWMNSPGHKKQIMKDYGTNGYIGIAKVYSSNGQSYWVELFTTNIAFLK